MDVMSTCGYPEVGVLPESWKVKRLGQIVSTLRGGIYGNEKTSDGLAAMPVATTAHISENDSWNSQDMQRRFFTPNQIATYSVKQGDLVIVKSSGSAASIKSGKIGLVGDEQAGRFVFSNFLMTLRPTGVNSRYLYFYLTSHNVKRLLPSLVEASTYPNLRVNEYLAIEIPIPEEQEQASIAEALSDANALIESLEQLLAKKRQIKHGAVQELLTGKKRLPGFSGGWEVRRLGDLFNFSGGFTASRDQLSSDGYCYLHYGDIHASKRPFVDVRSDYQDIPKLNVPLSKVSPASLLDDGDVVFVDASEDDVGTSKHVVVINPDGIPFISGLHTIVAKCGSNALVNPYRRYCFQTAEIRAQFYFFAVGTKVSGISKTSIERITLPVPSGAEQTAIAAILSDVDTEIDALEATLAKARQLKQGMMQELLTGRIRLV